MTESLASQIVIGEIGVIASDKEHNVKKRGRRRLIDGDKYLDAVKNTNCLSDRVIGNFLNVSRVTVYRFRVDDRNKEVIEDAKRYLNEIESINFNDSLINKELFKRIPTIKNWINIQKRRQLSKHTMANRINALYNVCTYLKTHPDNLRLDEVAEFVVEIRDKSKNGEKAPRGLAYYSIRKPIRSFFELIRGISGERLTSVGIEAGRSEGSGSQARERVSVEQRKKFEGSVKEVLTEINNNNVNYLREKKYIKFPEDVSLEHVYHELMTINYFMYYTATRIKATLRIKLNDEKHKFSENKWEIHVLDKGEKGGQHWQKMLVDDGLERMKNYLSMRFRISKEQLSMELPLINDFLFPFWYNRYRDVKDINKEAFKRIGVITSIPNHIWRHTYAQDALHATNFNYELVASIGGWASTNTMKLHYGEMSDDVKENGLRKMMGLPIEEMKYELRW